MRPRQKYIALIAVAGLLATGCTTSASGENTGGETSSVRVTTDGTMTSAAIHLGIEQGFFEDLDLNLEVSDSPNPSSSVAALQSSQVDIAAIPLVPNITAQSQKIDLVSFAPAAGYPSDSESWPEYDTSGIYGRPDSGISSPADLEGKKVAVNARKAVFEAYVQDAVVNDGGDPEKIEWVALDFGSQIEALRTGEVDVATLSMPFTFEAEANGAELLWSPGAAFFEGGLNSTWLASPDMADDTETLDKFRSAILQSNEYANENREEAIEMASELTGINAGDIADSGQFIYFPTEIVAEDLQRASQKLADLGFIDEPVDMTDRVQWSE